MRGTLSSCLQFCSVLFDLAFMLFARRLGVELGQAWMHPGAFVSTENLYGFRCGVMG